MRTIVLLLSALLAGGALAGCAGNEEPPTTTTPATTTTPTATTPTPTPTPTPTVTTPVTPTTPTPPTGTETATVDEVYVVSLTDSLASAGTAEVCWRVEGTGSIPHTAIHFDSESHPNATAFAEYVGGAVYPDNGPPVGPTYALPGTFCADLEASETTYFRPHALVPGQFDVLGPEKVVLVNDTRDVTFVNFLEIFPARFTNNICWNVDAPAGESTHTAIHWDTESHPDANATEFGLYAGGAEYPGDFTAANVSVTFPGQFCADLDMPDSGVVYMRAHAIQNGTHVISEERNVYVAPRVAVSGGLPATAAADSTVNVCWRAEGSGTSVHTALHFDNESHPGATSFTVYDGGAVYPDNGPATTSGSFELPGPFCADLTMPASGTLYFRPHAIYPGGFSELGREYAIAVA